MQKPEPIDEREALPPHALERELAQALEELGPAKYAGATARHFAKGGKYHAAKKRARYAID